MVRRRAPLDLGWLLRAARRIEKDQGAQLDRLLGQDDGVAPGRRRNRRATGRRPQHRLHRHDMGEDATIPVGAPDAGAAGLEEKADGAAQAGDVAACVGEYAAHADEPRLGGIRGEIPVIRQSGALQCRHDGLTVETVLGCCRRGQKIAGHGVLHEDIRPGQSTEIALPTAADR